MNAADFPTTLQEFEARFATEEACLAYLRAKKWPEGFRCRRCGGQKSWPVRRLEECAACGYQESVTAGTLFHQTRKPLTLWFRAVTLWVTSKRGLSAKELSRQLGLHYETAWHWCHRLRACVGATYGKTPLTGAVEVAQATFGGSADRAARWRGAVAGAVEVRGRAMGRVRLGRLPCDSPLGLRRFATRHAGARVTRSGGGAVPARVRRLFSLLQRVVLGTFHGSVSDKHLPAYLEEFQFRFNRRNSGNRWLLFERVLSAAPRFQPPTLAQLTRPGALPEPTRHPDSRAPHPRVRSRASSTS